MLCIWKPPERPLLGPLYKCCNLCDGHLEIEFLQQNYGCLPFYSTNANFFFTKQCTLTPTRTRPINHILFSHYNWLPGVQLSWKQDWLLSFVKPALLRFTWAKMKERECLVIRAVRRLKSCISVFEDEHNHCCCRPSVARKMQDSQ